MALFTDKPVDNPDDLQVDEKDYEAELVGEGKKFKTTKDLAKAKAQSDAFIEQLKNENMVARQAAERLQEELKQRKTLSEFMDQINSRDALQPPAKEPNNEGEGLNQESIEQIVEQTIAKRSAAQQGQINLDAVQQKLIETYGERYEQTLRRRTQELGMTEQEMTQMAMKSPRVFLALVSPTPSETTPSPLFPKSNVNTEALRASSGEKKNWSYYEKIRKTDTKKYFSPSTHNEMMQQLATLGDEEFYK